MPKKAPKARTPSTIMWDMIACEMYRQHMTKCEVAKQIGVSEQTIRNDENDPYKIPQWRLWSYFLVLGIDATTVLRPLAMEHAENMIRREET